MLDLDVTIESDEPLALDRNSARSFDNVGRLRVIDCKISKANICPYLGREIPRAAELGLDPDKIYRMYRDRAALKAAAPSFENVPLMLEHVAVSAADPKKSLTIGTVSNVRYEHPYLIADLCAWDAEAIRLIESGAQRELSCGYFYRAEMRSGTIDGEAYDGRLLDIVGNHVAIVSEGRVGPEVMVGDAAPGVPVPMHVAFPQFNRLRRL
jgi:hypothetical protein